MIGNKKIYMLVALLSLIICGCKNNKNVPGDFHFTLMDTDETHISFNNKITESDSVNVYANEYMYNGSGVGIGDFNNDGLADIFFCGSMVSSKLYINKGNFTFEDVTEKAGVQTGKWCTGVSIVDINNDGFMDIYICSSHSPDKEKRKNLLFINDGDLRFTKLQDYNSFDMPDKIKPAVFKNFKKTDDQVSVSLPPFSVVVLELK